APWVILSFAAMPAFFRKHPAESALVVGVFLSSLLFFAKYDSWHGGWVVGPRFLLPTLPLLILPLAAQIENLRHRAALSHEKFQFRVQRAALFGFLACGLLMQVVSLPYPVERFYMLKGFYEGTSGSPWWMRSVSLASLNFWSKRPATLS